MLDLPRLRQPAEPSLKRRAKDATDSGRALAAGVDLTTGTARLTGRAFSAALPVPLEGRCTKRYERDYFAQHGGRMDSNSAKDTRSPLGMPGLEPLSRRRRHWLPGAHHAFAVTPAEIPNRRGF